jgi:very-short-patch-repair endonuclease
LRQSATIAERLLWAQLRSHALGGLHFRRQAPIGPFIADFVCYRARLVIEVDGSQHTDRQAADNRRTAWLVGRGFRVLRFGNEEVLTNIDGVIEAIAAAIAVAAAPPPTPPPLRGGGSG